MAGTEEQDLTGQAVLDRGNVALVVDSTADLPPLLAADPNVFMVPLNVHFGDEVYKDWIDIRPEDFYRRLRSAPQPPRTSQPSAGSFISTYQSLLPRFGQIFSLHLSSKLSGTFESASLARSEVENVTVIDTGLASVGISLLVDRLLALLARGTTAEEILAYTERFRRDMGFLFMLSTLEYLQKGGRIGRASSLAGSLLSIKPLLTFTEGEVDVYRKVRGERKALAAIKEYFLEKTKPGRPVYLALGHADARESAERISQILDDSDRQIELRFLTEIGAVIGTYGGPGTVGLFFIQE
jgi:DegV family protein with EDD domain